MDEIDRKIVTLLGQDSRTSLAEIGGGVGLSTSAVNERVRRLVSGGVIRRFTVDADPAAFEAGVLAFVWVGLAPDADEVVFRAVAADHPAIIECHHVTGGWNYLVKIRVGSLAGVEAFLDDLKKRRLLARSETMIALSSVVDAPYCPRTAFP